MFGCFNFESILASRKAFWMSNSLAFFRFTIFKAHTSGIYREFFTSFETGVTKWTEPKPPEPSFLIMQKSDSYMSWVG